MNCTKDDTEEEETTYGAKALVTGELASDEDEAL